MECDKEEYQCSVSLCTAFDPVNITPTTFLYDRNTAETWVEKNPRTSTIPHTRQPFVVADITPHVALRAEMRQYFQDLMGNEYTGWEVIPEYPQLLSLHDIGDLLAQVRQFFPNVQEELRHEMSEEKWSNAWKRLNYLRLNLQMNPLNRQLFLSDESSIVFLREIMCRSYSRDVKTDDSDLFHREIFRTIRVLELIAHQDLLSDQLKPQNASDCARFKGFLLRSFQLADEGLQPIILVLLSLVSESLNPEDLYCIMRYIFQANAMVLSSTDIRNLATILDGFIRSKFIEVGNRQLIIGMQKILVTTLVQILIYAVAFFKKEDPMANVEDACEAIRLSLYNLSQLLGDVQEFQEARLACGIDNNLWTYIHEMIKLAIEQKTVHWNHLSADHWLLALNVAKLLYQNVGNADLMTEKEHRLYLSFLNTPVARHSHQLTDFLQIILQMFGDFVDIE